MVSKLKKKMCMWWNIHFNIIKYNVFSSDFEKSLMVILKSIVGILFKFNKEKLGKCSYTNRVYEMSV